MRITTIVIAMLVLAVALSGCIYSSANLMRAKGESIKVLGAWGYVDCKNAGVTLYRSMDAIAYPKDPATKYPKVPTRPTITEDDNDITIGKAPATPKPEPAPVTPEPVIAP